MDTQAARGEVIFSLEVPIYWWFLGTWGAEGLGAGELGTVPRLGRYPVCAHDLSSWEGTQMGQAPQLDLGSGNREQAKLSAHPGDPSTSP